MVKIISDSTCDLSEDFVERYDISILPLHVVMGEDEREDGVDITPDEIYEWADKTKSTPKTSAPSMERAIAMLEKYSSEYDHIIYFCISETMSASGNVVRLAAESLDITDKVTVINSKNLSNGIGYMVIEAADMAQSGAEASEIIEKINELIPKVRSSFVIDTLTYLQRGGRCSGVLALVGGALKLHPTILLEDGEMKVGRKYRGNISSVYMKYAKSMEDDYRNALTKRVMLVHSGCPRHDLLSVKNYLEELGIFDEVTVMRAGSVITSHCGPGTMGIMYVIK